MVGREVFESEEKRGKVQRRERGKKEGRKEMGCKARDSAGLGGISSFHDEQLVWRVEKKARREEGRRGGCALRAVEVAGLEAERGERPGNGAGRRVLDAAALLERLEDQRRGSVQLN